MNQELLRKLLNYDPVSGQLTWLERDRSYFSSDRIWKSWNTRYAGQVAFTAVNSDGYNTGSILGHPTKAHIVIYIMMTGEEPDEIDHWDGVGINNSWTNLKNGTHAQNMQNIRKSTLKGAYPHKGMFKAMIRHSGKLIYLGLYKTVEEAHEAYKAGRMSLGLSVG